MTSIGLLDGKIEIVCHDNVPDISAVLAGLGARAGRSAQAYSKPRQYDERLIEHICEILPVCIATMPDDPHEEEIASINMRSRTISWKSCFSKNP